MPVNVGQGTILEATIGATLTPIAQVTEIDGPEVTVGTAETTNLASLYKTYRAQLPDGGTVSFTIQYDPAGTTHTQIAEWVNVWPQQLVAWSITFATAGGTDKVTFSAFVTKFKTIGMNENDNLEAECELKISGPTTWT